MAIINNWNNKEIEIGYSKGGVIALSHPFDNLINFNNSFWPPPEIVQKMYRSNHQKSFIDENHEIVTKELGYYCDLQSMHSEDTLTWNFFGLLKNQPKDIVIEYLNDLFDFLDINNTKIENYYIWFWRRIPHPDTLVPGGPELDFGVLTDKSVIIVESKWLSGIGAKQGKSGTKDQIDLRIEFVKKYANKYYKNINQFIVLELTQPLSTKELEKEKEKQYNTDCDHSTIYKKNITWKELCNIKSHPNQEEIKRHLEWKYEHSRTKK